MYESNIWDAGSIMTQYVAVRRKLQRVATVAVVSSVALATVPSTAAVAATWDWCSRIAAAAVAVLTVAAALSSSLSFLL